MKKLFYILVAIILALYPSIASATPVYTPLSTAKCAVSRIFGQNRYQTALAVADKLATVLDINYTQNQQFQAVILASGNNWPDAISGTSLAKLNKAPILLLDSTSDALGSQETFQYMTEHVSPQAKVFILGGKGIMPQQFTDSLIKLGYSNSNIQQIGGKDRDETSFLIAKATNSHELALVSDQNFYDSISANPFYKFHDGAQCATILVPPNGILPQEESDYINISTAVMSLGDLVNTVDMPSFYPKLNWFSFSPYSITGFNTNVEAAGTGFTSAFVATGEDYPDALTGMVLANFIGGTYGSPIILTKQNTLPLASYTRLADILPQDKGNKVTSLTILGGTGAVSNNAVNDLINLITYTPPAEITSFSFVGRPSIVCTIDTHNKSVSALVSPDTDLTALVPAITLAPGVSISPAPGTPTDFNYPVIYALTDANGNTSKYSVIITPRLQAGYSDGTVGNVSFKNSDIQCDINEDTKSITATVPYGTDITSLIPKISVNPHVTVSLPTDTPLDFSKGPVSFTISAPYYPTWKYLITITTQPQYSPNQATQ